MAWQFKTLAALPGDLSLVPSTHMMVHNYLKLQFQGIQYLLLASMGIRCTHGAQTSMKTKHSYTK